MLGEDVEECERIALMERRIRDEFWNGRGSTTIIKNPSSYGIRHRKSCQVGIPLWTRTLCKFFRHPSSICIFFGAKLFAAPGNSDLPSSSTFLSFLPDISRPSSCPRNLVASVLPLYPVFTWFYRFRRIPHLE